MTYVPTVSSCAKSLSGELRLLATRLSDPKKVCERVRPQYDAVLGWSSQATKVLVKPPLLGRRCGGPRRDLQHRCKEAQTIWIAGAAIEDLNIISHILEEVRRAWNGVIDFA